MANAGYKILDCDFHIVEPHDLWQKYMEDSYKAVAPVGLLDFPVDLRVRVGDKVRPKQQLIRPPADKEDFFYVKRERRFGDSARAGWGPDITLDAMNQEGVDHAVLYPSRGLWVIADNQMDPGFAAAICRAYNNWLADFCQRDPSRFFAVGMISPHDIRDAVDEARRVKEKFGFRGVFLRPNPVRGRNWHDPYFEPLWEALEEMDMSLGFHEAYGPDLPEVGDRFGENSRLVHTVCHPMEMMLAMTSMIGGAVLERHPKLRVGFLEANCGWVPFLLYRLDEHFEPHAGYSVNYDRLSMNPTDYFKRQCYVSCEAEETGVKQVIELIGDDNLLFSNDWPHIDSKFPHTTELFLTQPITAQSKQKILFDNCVRYYNFKSGELKGTGTVQVKEKKAAVTV